MSEQLTKTITVQQFLVDQLKQALSQSMVDGGWGQDDAETHVNREFTIDRATEILERPNENKDVDTTDKGS